jgi:protein-L-isoaspartate(D-aspartate) O-methyltransferase
MVQDHLLRRGIRDPRVVGAMGRIPRHEFVSDEYRDQAYEDRPLPIGEGQTVSQPYIVAVTLEALSLRGCETVLEVGTGSGYQSAILAELARKVYSIERHESLAHSAEEVLARLNYTNIEIMVGDGSRGWPQRAPFDAIVVSAAAPRIPPAIFMQLREGGRMVIPVGPSEAQDLQLVRKLNGEAVVVSLNGCRFVPLIGEQGYQDD